jgi:hypothetical protein
MPPCSECDGPPYLRQGSRHAQPQFSDRSGPVIEQGWADKEQVDER